MYADVDRTFETEHLKMVISLQNIHQGMVVTPSGDIHQINSDDAGLASGATSELPNAKWKMDPKDIPAILKKAWMSLEFGQTSQAVVTIKQALGATDAGVKAAAAKLEVVVKEDLTKRMADAAAKVTANAKWEGYKLYEFVTLNYKPYPEAAKANAEMGKLRRGRESEKRKCRRR